MCLKLYLHECSHEGIISNRYASRCQEEHRGFADVLRLTQAV